MHGGAPVVSWPAPRRLCRRRCRLARRQDAGPDPATHLLTSGRIVLTIAKLGVGQESYYLSKGGGGIEDYYSGNGEVPGSWVGRGAARLGLSGEVAGGELRAVL